MNVLRLVLLSLLVAFAAGCASPPPPPPAPPEAPKGLNPAQKAALRELKFRETDGGWDLDLGTRIAFPVDDASITSDDANEIGRVASVLLSVGIDRLTVEGHADKQGGEAYNQKLSERRAEAVASALIAKGFASDHITRRGLGASRPVADNATAAGRLQNRRAVLIVPSL